VTASAPPDPDPEMARASTSDKGEARKSAAGSSDAPKDSAAGAGAQSSTDRVRLRSVVHEPFSRATAESLALVKRYVPQELQRLENWVAADRTPDEKGDPCKKPLSPLGDDKGNGDASAPSTWVSLDDAIAFALSDGRAFGVGVNLKGTKFVGIDLDHVIDPQTGEVNPLAMELVESLHTYTERSPSGTGIRMFLRGRKPSWFPRSSIKDAFGPGTQLEVYDGGSSGRYLTCTGNIWHDEPLPIAAAGSLEQLRQFVPKEAPKPKPSSSTPPPRNRGVGTNDDLQRAQWVLDNVFTDPDAFSYDDWLLRMMELASLGPDGEALAMAWSSRGSKHNERKEQSRFAGFRGDRTIASLFGEADKVRSGWRSEFRRESSGSTEAQRDHGAATASSSTGSSRGDVRLTDWTELLTAPPVEYLIEEVIPEAGTGLLAGVPQSAKSAQMVDWMLRLAHGTPWRGHEVTKCSSVYLAGEGQQGMAARLRAWKGQHQPEPTDGYVVVSNRIPKIADAEHGEQILVEMLETLIARKGHRPGLLVVDTLSQALAGGDENGSDVVPLLNNLAAIRDRFGCTTIAVHHVRKPSGIHRNGQPPRLTLEDIRGSSAIVGNVDFVIAAERLAGTEVELTILKAKDGITGTSFAGQIHSVETGVVRRNGKLERSVVIIPAPAKAVLSPEAAQEEHQEQLWDSAEKRVQNAVETLRKMGRALSQSSIVERMSGRRVARFGAVKDAIARKLIVDLGTDRDHLYVVAGSPECVLHNTPTPPRPGTGNRPPADAGPAVPDDDGTGSQDAGTGNRSTQDEGQPEQPKGRGRKRPVRTAKTAGTEVA
jgi:hypothetical protein